MKIQNITDGYKVYHFQQYPEEIKSMYGNLTARGDKHFERIMKGSNPLNKTYVAFGMQQAMKEIIDSFDKDFFSRPKSEVIEEMEKTIGNYIGFENGLCDRIGELHDHGYLPITVKTVNEGDFVNMNDPAMIIETEEGFAWVFGYLEPVITNMVWKTITNATTAFEFYKIAKLWGDVTGTNEMAMKFGFHDFSSRGMAGKEDASRNGVPHLLFFSGTESVGALGYVEEVYGYDYEEEGMLAGSIKATEHSVSTSNIFFEIEKSKKYVHGGISLMEAEEEFFSRYITEIYPNGLVAYVADSFDFYKFIYDVLPKYKDEINAREGKLVIRPDSFEDPIKGVLGTTKLPFFLTIEDATKYVEESDIFEVFNAGYEGANKTVRVLDKEVNFSIDQKSPLGGKWNFIIKETLLSPEETGTLPKLLAEFGFTKNEKGYAELNPKIGLIYGDGFSLKRTNLLFETMTSMDIATSNIVIGVGGGSYSWISRDTLGIAYKTTSFATEVDGSDIHVDVYKDPKGVNKTSAKGRFTAKKKDGLWEFKDQVSFEDSEDTDLVVLYKDGVLNEVKFADIRKNIMNNIEEIGFKDIF